MSQPPNSLPEQPSISQRSRYRRPRRYISWAGLFIGLLLGLSGGLYYTWIVQPVIETDTRPAQLRREDKTQYVIAIMLAFRYDSDLGQAVSRLSALDLGADPIGEVADMACNLAQEGYMNSSSGLRALRSMKLFYQLQGRSSCADDLIPDIEETQVVQIDVPTPTPTLPPPPSKTPIVAPTATPAGVQVVPTNPPRRQFDGYIQRTYCDTELSGTIEVRVLDANTNPLPAQPVRVRWGNDQEDQFVTGLKPERGLDYADFEMESGRSYIVDMPGLSDPLTTPIVADGCITEGGEDAITSYVVYFVRDG